MFSYSQGIQDAFDALRSSLTRPDGFDDEVAIREIVDFDYYLDTYNNGEDAIKAAFSLGQDHPDCPVYEIEWGDDIAVWFFGNEKEIIAKLRKRQADLES